jgi:hypothetical protein
MSGSREKWLQNFYQELYKQLTVFKKGQEKSAGRERKCITACLLPEVLRIPDHCGDIQKG